MRRLVYDPRQRLVSKALALAMTGCASASLAAPIAARLPFAAQVTVLLPSGTVAGRNVSIARFESSLDPDRALEQAAQSWRRDPRSPVLEGSAGVWRTLSRQEPTATVTIQIHERTGGGSVGLISVWARDSVSTGATGSASGRDPSVTADRPQDDWVTLLPEGSTLARSTSSQDVGRRSTTVVAVHDGPLPAVWQQLLARIGQRGFTPSRGLSSPSGMRQARAAAFRRSDTELVVTVDARGDRLGIVMHLIEGQP